MPEAHERAVHPVWEKALDVAAQVAEPGALDRYLASAHAHVDGDCECGLAPRLLAAAETAIRQHVPQVIESQIVTVCSTCRGRPIWPCQAVRDITAALAGKADPHA